MFNRGRVTTDTPVLGGLLICLDFELQEFRLHKLIVG